jgi:hypothetical protein
MSSVVHWWRETGKLGATDEVLILSLSFTLYRYWVKFVTECSEL